MCIPYIVLYRFHSPPSKLVQIPDCPRHSLHTNSNQTQQNPCQFQKTRYSSKLVTEVVSFSFPKTNRKNTVAKQFDNSLSMAKSVNRCIFPQFLHHLLCEIPIKVFNVTFHLVLEVRKSSNFHHIFFIWVSARFPSLRLPPESVNG